MKQTREKGRKRKRKGYKKQNKKEKKWKEAGKRADFIFRATNNVYVTTCNGVLFASRREW